MTAKQKPPKMAEYARSPAIKKAVEEVRKLDLDVAGVEFHPGGVIRILTPMAFPAQPKDEFEQWEQSGRLG